MPNLGFPCTEVVGTVLCEWNGGKIYMKNLYKALIAAAIVSILTPSILFASAPSDDFDFLLLVTRQNMEMDWWFSVPSRFSPEASSIKEVVKKEYFSVFPVFSNYGLASDEKSQISFNVEILQPDGNVYESITDIDGYSEKPPGPFLLPSVGRLTICFEPEDVYGEYTISVTAFDHIKGQRATKSHKVLLEKFDLNAQEVELSEWYLNYPVSPKPSLALSALINSPKSLLDEDGQPLWSALWLYKTIYEQNEFLYPYTVEYFKTSANSKQQKDILLLFHFLGKVSQLASLKDHHAFIDYLNNLQPPDPYGDIYSGAQLDMLWAEFFASSRIEPIRQIVSALNLRPNMGTLDEIKAGKADPSSEEVMRKAYLEATFRSALWSLTSNCKQSSLVFKYCVSLYESDDLNEMENNLLGMVLQQVVEEMEKVETQAAG